MRYLLFFMLILLCVSCAGPRLDRQAERIKALERDVTKLCIYHLFDGLGEDWEGNPCFKKP